MAGDRIGTDMRASNVMTRNVLAAQPDWPIEQLAEFLVKNAISGAPVVAEDGELVGVVSLTDLARASTPTEDDLEPRTHAYYLQMLDAYDSEVDLPIVSSEEGGQIRVSEIMTPIVIAVAADDSVRRVAEIMIDNKVHRLFVTKARKIEGVITALDMLKAIRDS